MQEPLSLRPAARPIQDIRCALVPVMRSALVMVAIAMVASLMLPSRALAQGAPPVGWKWTLDGPARLVNGGRFLSTDSTFDFVHMAPGWHITMGPGAVLYDPAERASGRFVVEGELILFPDASANEYGVFVGGKSLDDEARKEWIALVVRADGQVAVMRQRGNESTWLIPWRAHAASKVLLTGASAKNYVTVRAEPDSVRFVVNGERVAAFERSALDVDGPFGFRIGKGVNLHITNLDVTRRMAPFPAPKRP
ncbi:MAG: hypothetical protein ACKVS7_07480 [Gemmatimonadaceae bacterium]